MENNNKEWLERVINEQDELCAKIQKLVNALRNNEFVNNLSKDEIDDLYAQLTYMTKYSSVLSRRITRAGGKDPQDKYLPNGKIFELIRDAKIYSIITEATFGSFGK